MFPPKLVNIVQIIFLGYLSLSLILQLFKASFQFSHYSKCIEHIPYVYWIRSFNEVAVCVYEFLWAFMGAYCEHYGKQYVFIPLLEEWWDNIDQNNITEEFLIVFFMTFQLKNLSLVYLDFRMIMGLIVKYYISFTHI